ncbi:hypothetical protein WM24_23645 [Burkholderia ubonensis]|uniref:hypothetical protein n=1 Tax=Burkholderia ubonensis TaxID=101571 RepID=UPI0007550B63|nr:hypothetical protein [Burkholderia ubonensis]KWN80833.1 hypothetical protein WM24_23645 [Burkholderia ubonensis]
MTKYGHEVKVGDVLRAFGREVQVKSIRPYQGLFGEVLGVRSQVAAFHGTTIEITLPEHQRFELV